MKSIKYLNIIVGVILFFSVISCDDILDVSPEVDITAGMIFNKPSDFANATNALYEYLPNIMNYVGTSDDNQKAHNRDGVMQRDLDTDLVSNFTASTRISSSNIGPDESYNRYLYQNYYKRVRISNYILEKAAEYANQEEIKQYIGECYFFRAFNSFVFYRDFGPGIIVERTLDENSNELNGARAERLDFFNWMIEDLQKAVGYFTKTENLATDDIGRITVEAAQALIARLFLFEGSWQKYHPQERGGGNTEKAREFFQLAAKFAKEVIDSGQFELFRDNRMGDESYRWMFILETTEQSNPYNVTKSSNKEYILRNRFDENMRQSGDNIGQTVQAYYATRKMMEMYLDTEGLPIEKSNLFDGFDDWDSFRNNRDPRLVYSLGYVGQQVWSFENNGRVNWTGDAVDMATQTFVTGDKKAYRNLKWLTERAMGEKADGFDVPVIRLAEMYLIYAEAIFEANNESITDEDLNYSLNKVRARVSMPPLTNGFIRTHGLDMKTEIRRERAVEFYLEGLRLDDLRRWATAEEEMSANIEGFPYTYKGKSTIYASGGTRGVTFVLRDADGNALLNSNGKTITYTYKKTTETEAHYPDGSSYVVFESGESRVFGPHNYFRPIPREEYDMNPDLEPNPGWSK